jgi:uncharacterized RDD family membrane protein YckC
MTESVWGDGDGPPYGRLADELLAGRWRRLFAGAVDCAILGVLTRPILERAGVYDPMERYEDFAAFVFHLDWLWLMSAGFIWFAYYATLTAYWHGQTLGKKALGIRVVQANGERVTPRLAAVRALMAGFLIVLGVYVVDLVWIVFSRRRQAVHDLSANTVVMIE